MDVRVTAHLTASGDTPGLRIGSLFSGYGGLEQGVIAAMGGQVAWHSEIEPAATALLAHRYPDVPNLGDITQIDWRTVEPVDVLTGGFPCQDVSSAGRRLGMRPGTRSGLWEHMAYAVDQLRPGLVVIENVRGLLSADAACDLEPCPWCLGDHEGRPLRALGAVCGDLANLGYVGRWGGLRAADVGAPHGRFRIFIVAWPAADAGGGELQRRRVGGVVAGAAGPGEGEGPERERDRHAAGHGGEDAAYAAGPGRGLGEPVHVADDCGPPVRAGQAEPGRRDRDAPTDAQSPGREGTRPEPARGGPERGRRPTPADPEGPGLEGWRHSRGRRPGSADGTAADTEGERREWGARPAGSPASRGRRPDHPDAALVADADRDGLQVVREGAEPHPRHDADGRGAGVCWGDYAPAIRRWERILGRTAPAPTVIGMRGGRQLSSLFVEWMQGLPAGWVTDVPGLSRNEQLKLLGNGVVPAQAEAALRWLLASSQGRVAA